MKKVIEARFSKKIIYCVVYDKRYLQFSVVVSVKKQYPYTTHTHTLLCIGEFLSKQIFVKFELIYLKVIISIVKLTFKIKS